MSDDATLCPCLDDATPHVLGPLCIRSKETTGTRKHGGPAKCPRACGECSDGAHHFCESDMQSLFGFDVDFDLEDDDEDDLEEKERIRNHPAKLAGCTQWYECRHCDAWMEADDNDELDEGDEDLEDEDDDFEDDE